MDYFFVRTVKVQTITMVEQTHRRSHYDNDFEEIHAPYTNAPKHAPKHVCFEERNKENDVLVCFRIMQCLQTSTSMCILS